MQSICNRHGTKEVSNMKKNDKIMLLVIILILVLINTIVLIIGDHTVKSILEENCFFILEILVTIWIVKGK
jgi:hypothetical protein